MKILLTVNYLIDTDKYNFWNKGSGHLDSEIEKSLNKRFPKKMKLSNNISGKRYSLTYKAIDFKNANLVICPICGRLLTDRKKPNPIEELDNVADLSGTMMSRSCAWELELDVDIYGIEYVLNRFNTDK